MSERNLWVLAVSLSAIACGTAWAARGWQAAVGTAAALGLYTLALFGWLWWQERRFRESERAKNEAWLRRSEEMLAAYEAELREARRS